MSIGHFAAPAFMALVLGVGVFASVKPTPILTPPSTLGSAPPKLGSLPPLTLPNADKRWEPLVNTPEMAIELDTTSGGISVRDGGFEVTARMRIQFFNEIDIEGSSKKGWYYVNEMVSVCKDATMRIDKSTVYSRDNKELIVGERLGSLVNPKNPKSFVTAWVYIACAPLQGKKVPVII